MDVATWRSLLRGRPIKTPRLTDDPAGYLRGRNWEAIAGIPNRLIRAGIISAHATDPPSLDFAQSVFPGCFFEHSSRVRLVHLKTVYDALCFFGLEPDADDWLLVTCCSLGLEPSDYLGPDVLEPVRSLVDALEDPVGKAITVDGERRLVAYVGRDEEGSLREVILYPVELIEPKDG